MSAFAPRTKAKAIPIHLVPVSGYRRFLGAQKATVVNWLKTTGFKPVAAAFSLVPGRNGEPGLVVGITESEGDIWTAGALAGALPPGRYDLKTPTQPEEATLLAIAWGLGHYQYTRYKKGRPRAKLVWPKGANEEEATAAVEGIALGRDLVTTPAGDMGPQELAAAAKELAARHKAHFKVIVGDALLKQNYPTIHAVGRASDKPPLLIDLRWGRDKDPKVTLVGKGVCFDSGGLDIKSAAGMKLMKKDMGGAASVLALAHMIMSGGLKVRLRVLIPAVENSVAGNAFHPMDVITTRKGTTVEVGNTDAEGRLILCDALHEASSEKPKVLLDFATLTGAARVALGTELPALFCNNDALAQDILDAGLTVSDPLWRMPLHNPYRRFLESEIADMNNISKVGPGGAITAALFLREFVGSRISWAHVDTMAYNAQALPGRPPGGEVFGARAMYRMLAKRFAQ